MRKTQLAFVALFAIAAIVASSALVSAQETQVTSQAPILTADQKTELRTMMEQFRAEVKTTVESKLSELGITITEGQSRRDFMSSLTQDQRDALRTEMTAMREAFREQIKAKLGEWGVQLPDPGTGPFNGKHPGAGMGPGMFLSKS